MITPNPTTTRDDHPETDHHLHPPSLRVPVGHIHPHCGSQSGNRASPRVPVGQTSPMITPNPTTTRDDHPEPDHDPR
jgi:hypothetical protein